MNSSVGGMEDLGGNNASTSDGSYSGFLPVTSESLLNAASILDLYYTPLLCFVGVLGNCLSVIVFYSNGSHRQLSSAFYLSALAISDTGFLLTLFAFWLDGTRNGMILSTNLGCPFIMYTAQVFCFLSVWLTVGFTVERYFAVCSPFTRPSVCTVSKAKKVTAGLTAAAILLFSYVLIIARVVPKDEILSYMRDHQNGNRLSSFEVGKHQNISASTRGNMLGLNNPQEEFTYGEKSYLDAHTAGSIGKQRENSEIASRLEYSVERDSVAGRTDYFDGRAVDESTFSRTEMHKRHSRSIKGKVDESLGLLSHEEYLTDPGIQYDSEGPLTSSSRKAEPYASEETNESVEEITYHENGESTENPSTISATLVCTVPPQFLTVSIIANYIDSTITLIIPFCLIAYLNIRITLCVMRVKEERKKMVAIFKIDRRDESSDRKSCVSDSINSQSSVEEENETKKTDYNLPLKQANGQRRKSTIDFESRIAGGESSKRIKCESSEPNPHKRKNEIGNSKDDQSLRLDKSFSLGECQGERSVRFVKDNCSCDSNCLCRAYLYEDGLNGKEERGIGDDMLKTTRSKISIVSTSKINGKILNCMGDKAVQSNRETTVGTNGMKAANRRKFVSNPKSFSKVKRSTTNGISNSASSETRVTKILLLVSSVFLLLNLPSHAIRAAAFIQNLLWENDRQSQRMLHAAQQLSNILLFNTNFAVNFLLYCLSGRNFRESLKKVLFRTEGTKRSPLQVTFRLGALARGEKRNLKFGESRCKNESTVVFDDDDNDEIQTEMQLADLA